MTILVWLDYEIGLLIYFVFKLLFSPAVKDFHGIEVIISYEENTTQKIY